MLVCLELVESFDDSECYEFDLVACRFVTWLPVGEGVGRRCPHRPMTQNSQCIFFCSLR